MSLKAIHILFIVASTALAIFLAVWFFMEYAASHARASLYYGTGSSLAVLVLICYGRYFLRKLKHISYL